jgi:hypothetical protein
MSVPDGVYIEICPVVREQLGWLELAERKDVIEGLYELVPLERVPIRRPGLPAGHFTCVILGYVFEYRRLSSAELKDRRRESGYRVLVMKAPPWISDQFGWS